MTVEPPFKGRFIVIEGSDFCGKGTQHRMLTSYLIDYPKDRDLKLINVVATREPYNTQYQTEIRRILKEITDSKARAEKFAELFVKDRLEHVEKLIIPCKKQGCVVVSDRYKYSTEAYQSAQGILLDKLVEMHKGMPVPDLVFFINTSLENRLQRKASARERPYYEVFDKDATFQKKLDEQYETLLEVHKDEPIVVIDGNRSKEEVFASITEHVDSLLFP